MKKKLEIRVTSYEMKQLEQEAKSTTKLVLPTDNGTAKPTLPPNRDNFVAFMTIFDEILLRNCHRTQ